MQNGPTETSVLVSLRELVSLEDERLAEEEEARERAAAAAERARREALEQARSAEEARRLAEEQARLARAREEAEEQARLAAIAQGEVERARIEARSVAAQAARETELAHERVRAQQENERQKTRLELWGIGLVLAAVVGVGGLGILAMQPGERTEDPRIAQLEREQQQLLRDRLSALDAFHERLQEKLAAYEGRGADFDGVHRAVTAARVALEDQGLTDDRLKTYEAALDRLATEVGRAHRLARLSMLREMHDRLGAQAEKGRRPTPALKSAITAAETSRGAVDAAEPLDQQLERYDRSLQKLAGAIADQPVAGIARGHGAASSAGDSEPTTPPCDFHDPLCATLTP